MNGYSSQPTGPPVTTITYPLSSRLWDLGTAGLSFPSQVLSPLFSISLVWEIWADFAEQAPDFSSLLPLEVKAFVQILDYGQAMAFPVERRNL